MIRTAARFALRWGFAGFVFIAVLEVCIRFEDHFRWNAPLLGGYSYDGLFVTDSLGRHLRSGYEFQKWRINRFGFRGPEVDRMRPPGTVRIAVLGSSEAFGHTEARGQEFPRQLDRALRRPPQDRLVAVSHAGAPAPGPATAEWPRFEVLNAGVPGMSIARIEEHWNRWVNDFDVQIAVVYPNPAFYLASEPPADSTPYAGGDPTFVRNEIRLIARTKAAIDRLLPETFEVHLKRLLIARMRSGHASDWTWDAVPEHRLRLYERHLRRLLDTLNEAGVHVVLSTHASSVERPLGPMDRVTLVRWQRFQPRADPEVILDFEARANEITLDLAAERGVDVVPLHALVPKDGTHFSDHQHFTAEGAAVVAEALATVLRPAGLALAAGQAGVQVESEVIGAASTN